jgi:hypothetical protein
MQSELTNEWKGGKEETDTSIPGSDRCKRPEQNPSKGYKYGSFCFMFIFFSLPAYLVIHSSLEKTTALPPIFRHKKHPQE